MDRKEAETSLKNDWYVNNGNLIVEHDKVNRFLEACGMGIKSLHEPERKKGQWIGDFDNSKYNDWHCSNCGEYYPERNKKLLGNYCPWCGAKMDGKKVE